MRQKKPYISNILKLPSPITRVQRFNDNIAIITNKSFLILAPFKLDRELGGICHVNYQHTKRIIAICPVCVRNSYIASLFYGDGSYIYQPKKSRIKKKINTENHSPKIFLPEIKQKNDHKPFYNMKKVTNFIKRKVFTDSNHKYRLNPSSSISKLLIDEDNSSEFNNVSLKSVITEPIFSFDQMHSNFSLSLEQPTPIGINENSNSNFNEEEEDSSLIDLNNIPITIVIKTTIIIYILLFLTSDFFQTIDFLIFLNVIIIYLIISNGGENEISLEFDSSMQSYEIIPNESDRIDSNFGFEENNVFEEEENFFQEEEQNNEERNGWNVEPNRIWKSEQNENQDEISNDWRNPNRKRNCEQKTEDEVDNSNDWRNPDRKNTDFKCDDSKANENEEEEEEEEEAEFDDEESLNKYNSETIWLYVDSDNCFSAFSINLGCTLIKFKFPHIKNIVDICGINNPKCINGQFAILTKSDVFVCEMPLKKEKENEEEEEETDEMDKYLVFIYQIKATNISQFLNGFLMMRDQIIEFYHDSKISAFYGENPFTTYFVTSAIDRRNKKRYENLISYHDDLQIRNNKVIILQKEDENILLFEMNSDKKLGIKKCNLLGVCDEWAVSLCARKFLIISNINDKDKSIKIPLDMPTEKLRDMNQIIVGYNNWKDSLVILLIFSDEIDICYADLSIFTDDFDEEEEEEEEDT